MGLTSPSHLLLLALVLLVVFGTGKIGNFMGEFGKGIKQFKENVRDDKNVPDASMSGPPPGSISPPLPEPVVQKSSVNQG